MKESIDIAKEVDAKKGFSPTKSDNSIHRVKNEHEKRLGSLRSVIDTIGSDGGAPSVNSIATQLSGMHTAQRASVLLALQRTHGNRYVQRVVVGIQAKLTIGQPTDKYEQEADRVMQMSEHQSQQQKGEEEEKKIQTKPLIKYIFPLFQRQVEKEEEEEPIQAKLISSEHPILQRPEEGDEEKPIMIKSISRRTHISEDLHIRLNRSRGGGQPLPEANRNFMERRFGIDFSGVRVHTDSDTAQMSRELNAEAFTLGKHIYFGAGRYSPGTSSGKRLLAHELTHVIQQSNAKEEGRIQCHECETAALHRCPGTRVSTVVSAFQEAASCLPQAKLRIENYINVPIDRTNHLAASALRQHFSWTEDIRQQLPYPDIPQMVLSVINNSLSNITQPIHAFCPPTPSSTVHRRDIYAGSPTAWAGTNCYEFYEPFFTERAPRGKISIHEMMHSWESMNDVAYEGDDDYPPNARAAQNNADSYAALIRDLGI